MIYIRRLFIGTAVRPRAVMPLANITWASQYEYGLGTERDIKQAVSWYGAAASQGYGAAENNLGHLYEVGDDLPQDYEKALYWYRRAADHGDSDGQCNTAIM